MSQQNDLILSQGPPLVLERRTYYAVGGEEQQTFRLLDSTHVLIRAFSSWDAAIKFWKLEYPFRSLDTGRFTYRPQEDKRPWSGMPYIDTGDYT